jgi:hypothetical protein
MGLVVALPICIPLLMGGCPEFRNDVINAANAATQGIVVSDQDSAEAFDTASRAFWSAVIDLAFDQLRDDSFR